MKHILMYLICMLSIQHASAQTAPWNELSPEAARVVEDAGTERPGTGAFLHHDHDGTYTCARCRAPLFASDTKFDSGCGWPSFDDALAGAVSEIPDADGHRVEIRCARCDAHLGHVFRGERMTDKNTRHCVNSVSMDFTGGLVEQALSRANRSRVKVSRGLVSLSVLGDFFKSVPIAQRALGTMFFSAPWL